MNDQKILLLNPPCDNAYYISVQPPLGLLYIAAYLKENNIHVQLLDLNVERHWTKTLKKTITQYQPTIVGLSSNISNKCATLNIASQVKALNPFIDIIVGGPQPTIDPEAYHSINIDFLIPHEGEKVMLEFIKNRPKMAKKKHNVPVMLNKRNDPIADLDTIPFPAYELIDIKKYYVNSFKKRPLVSMITSRGCPSKCIFCNQMVSGRKWRGRSAENVVEEMQWLEKKIGAREISIEDDNFTFDIKRVYKICSLKQKYDIKLSWQLANGIRVNNITKDLLATMKQSGCWKIAIAPEVGDELSLKKIKKGSTLEQFRKVAKWCKELDMVYYGFFLIGFPFQSEDDIKKTINLALELDPLIMDLSKVVPFKGTELYETHPELCSHINDSTKTYYDKQNNASLEKIYKNAYYRFYLRMPKIIEIIRKIGLRSFLRFIKYGFETFYLNK